MREQEILIGAVVDRSIWTLIRTIGTPPTGENPATGAFISLVHINDTPESHDAYNKWYNEEHLDLISGAVTGFIRARRYKGAVLEGKASYLAVYDVANVEEFLKPGLRESLETKWAKEIFAPGGVVGFSGAASAWEKIKEV